MADTSTREFDIVLWGASGFTGCLVAEYLASRDGADELDWALGGRNRDRLREVRRSLGDDHADLPIVVGDSLDRQSLDDIAARTRVVCSTVGPYARLGSPLVTACVEAGTDYCDLTGEAHWIREMIDTHHQAARDGETRIVHCCGFDSVPSDLGTYLVQSEAVDRYGGPCAEVRALVWDIKGGVSGGTAASMSDLMADAADDPSIRDVVTDPYGLNPEGERSGPDGPMQQSPSFEPDLDTWTAPFLMAAVNEKVVRRTNALLDYRYGDQFQYSEATRTGDGLGGAARAAAVAGGQAAFGAGMALGPTRRLLRRFFLPESGEGPDEESMRQGRFRIRFFGKNPGGDREATIVADVASDTDPGYGSTARMLGESALCLALEETTDGLDGGVLTPASAFGSTLIDRLEEAGVTFEIRR